MKEHKLKPYSFPITDELKEALQKLAAADSRTLANYVRTVLERHARDQGALVHEHSEEPELATV
jgi:predicted DNA-binding protein